MWGRKHLWLKQLLPSSRSYHTAKHPNAKGCNQHNSRSITENQHDCHCHCLQLQPIFQLISTSIWKGKHPVPSHRQHVHCARNIETDLGWQFQKQIMDYGGFISANCKQRNMHSKCNIANKRNMHTLHCKETCTVWITLQQSASISKCIKASDAKLLISTRCKNPGTMCMCTQTEEEDGHDHGGGGASAFQ